MAKRPKVSPRLPFEQTAETLETPDVEAFRAFEPSTAMLQPALAARFGQSRQNVTDQYGAYSGIPSQVARNRMRDEALRGIDESEGLALAEGSERAQALKMAQLETLANMTAKRRQFGYNTQLVQPQSSGLLGSGISAGGAITAAAIAA